MINVHNQPLLRPLAEFRLCYRISNSLRILLDNSSLPLRTSIPAYGLMNYLNSLQSSYNQLSFFCLCRCWQVVSCKAIPSSPPAKHKARTIEHTKLGENKAFFFQHITQRMATAIHFVQVCPNAAVALRFSHRSHRN